MQQIVDALTDRKCVVFAGAGISRDAGLPDWQGLGQQLRDELKKEGKVPTWCEDPLGNLLQEKETVPKAIDLIVSNIRREDVVQALRTILVPSRPSKACQALGKLRPRGIVTTNYDRVLDPILPPQQYRLTNSLEKLKQVPTAVASGHGFLLKLHGDIDDGLDPSDPLVGQGAPFMVLSRGDYAALVQGYRREALILALYSILQSNSVLFLGYSFTDPDIICLFRFLTEHCQFPHPSWCLGLKGECLPSLPDNVTGIKVLDTWDDLAAWLSSLRNDAVKSRATRDKRRGAEEPRVEPLSVEQRRAFLAVGRYLTDLESNDLAERVLASAMLEDVSKQAEFAFDWLSNRVAKLIEVGPALAIALARATASYLTELGLIELLPDGRMRTVKMAVETLRSRALREWQKDRDSFYASIARRLDGGGSPIAPEFDQALDAVLQDLCVDFGEGMAEWVHRGVGRELGWQRARDLVASHFKDREDIRKANAVLDSIFRQPSDDEVYYLYRLLGAAFLANSVRLDPSTSSAVKRALSSYELFLDTNVLLPLVIEEHMDHRSKKAVIEESRDAGVKLIVIEAMFHEMCGHRDSADRIVEDCEESFSRLSELVDVLGARANCFVQAYVRILSSSEPTDQGANAGSPSVTWKHYRQRYTDAKLRERLERLGLSIIRSHEDAVCSADYRSVLNAIAEEWAKRSHGYERPSVLNENEARQFCHVYARRAELGAAGVAPQVWFLSYETVLAKVFERNANKWGMPPTFPFSAWVAFLDSRLPWVPKDPRAIVNAILKGHSSAFALPDPIDLVRKKAFGDRVTTKAEEDAVQLALSGFHLVTRVDRARAAILARGNLRDGAREFEEARKAAVGEIKSALEETISRLQGQLERQQKELLDTRAKLREQQEELERGVRGRGVPEGPKGVTPHKRKRRK
ncbi:MAG: SIR2 family protein [Chloroflexi bacterium]|nr:SIR2 family protein [Chloroflexota bacterium]